jgi:subtilisin family serine protease
MGWEATILPVRVVGPTGADSLALAEAISYTVDLGADVINLSLGSQTVCPQVVQDAVDYAHSRDVVLIAAAGNDGVNAQSFPANCYYVLGVAATTPDDARAGFSNYGTHVTIAAPGGDIYSTALGGGYEYRNGTSMATPYVTGLAALVRARYPDYTSVEVVSAILDNAVDLGSVGWDPYYGCGRIDAARTLSVGAHSSVFPICLQGGGGGQWDEGIRDEGGTVSDAPFVPGEVIVAFRPGTSGQAVQAVLRLGIGAEYLPRLGVWRLRVPAGQERAILDKLLAESVVDYAELNYVVSPR